MLCFFTKTEDCSNQKVYDSNDDQKAALLFSLFKQILQAMAFLNRYGWSYNIYGLNNMFIDMTSTKSLNVWIPEMSYYTPLKFNKDGTVQLDKRPNKSTSESPPEFETQTLVDPLKTTTWINPVFQTFVALKAAIKAGENIRFALIGLITPLASEAFGVFELLQLLLVGDVKKRLTPQQAWTEAMNFKDSGAQRGIMPAKKP
ncbi:hypothetical protein BDF19DRAFT_498173 [Syncephalis fuscata]|nr:hypothetical protein BDF19DRAFT_498173 [Syncephalis fuscata]